MVGVHCITVIPATSGTLLHKFLPNVTALDQGRIGWEFNEGEMHLAFNPTICVKPNYFEGVGALID
jgi:hypothetical protein